MALARVLPPQASSVAFGLAFGTHHFSSYLRLVVYSLLQFLAGGFVISASLWYVCNHHLKAPVVPHSVEQDVEWLYAFDIHCNAFVPVFILTHGVQVRGAFPLVLSPCLPWACSK